MTITLTTVEYKTKDGEKRKEVLGKNEALRILLAKAEGKVSYKIAEVA